ncbi:MAG: TonB-dependent receptor [Zoogloea sp.]|jgi:iron complex outermembrane receptor protein|uniref:TonB-dependent receptor n=1 Tax=Zoogloea sp. TaxID=49181 RepID=UPI0026351BCA|nr:TonB-dependent receptor [Zoogloea sp.]MDD3326826.1 TonB-dependent receptor [Zoogloea sp.]
MKIKALPLTLATLFASTADGADSGEATLTLGAVTVSAAPGPLPIQTLLTSVDILGGDKVADKNVANSWELLGQMPGVQLTETRMGTESGKATLRAFNGEGYINGIKVLIDGVPSNVNSGNQRFIDMIFPLDIEYIEVVRGTNDPRHGLHNIGGNINIGTRQGGNYADGRLSYGSYNTREAQLALGRESDGLAQNYFLAKQDSDGHRDHARSGKYSLGGKWFYTTSDNRLRLGLTARLYEHTAEEPGYLTAAELAASRRQSPSRNANDGGDRDMQQISADLDWQIRPDLMLSNKLYHNRYVEDRRITFTSYTVGNAPRQRRQWDETQSGLLSALTWRAGKVLTLDGGINLERQDNEYRRYRYSFSDPTDFSAPPARVQNDDRHTFNNVGAYVQAILRPADRLKIIPAFRADRFSGNTRLNTSGVSAPLQDYGWINQPKLSMVYTVSPGTHLYANWGRTFQVLTGSREPAYLTAGQTAYKPSINTGKEIGVKVQPTPGTEARIAVWQQDATDEVANMPSTGTTIGLGETRRKGIDLQLSSRLSESWTVWASHAVQEAKVVRAYTSGGVPLAGKEVFSTPRFITNLGAEYRANADWRLGLQGRAQGDYYIDELNAKGKHGGFVVLDASLRHALTPKVSIDLQIRNLTDRKYEYVWYDNFFWGGNDQPMFSPAQGRSGYLSLNLKM